MIKILVTGFGAFPGARHNPSLALLALLARKRARLARLGIMLEVHAIPVVYAGLAPLLAKLAAEMRPDAILHFGVAGRRKIVSMETRACNRMSRLRPDAVGAQPQTSMILAGGPAYCQSRVPVRQIAAAWRRLGIAGDLSNDAGDYLCNAIFYHSLVAPQAACVGFIHIPYPRRRIPRPSPEPNRRPRLAEIAAAAEIALVSIATAVRRHRSPRPCVIADAASGFSP